MSKKIFKLEDISSNDSWVLKAIFTTDSHEELPFRFSNSTYRLQQLDLVVEQNGSKLEYVEIKMISPINWSSLETTISIDNPFTYEIKGVVEDLGDKVLLKMKGVSYLLLKNIDCYFYLKIRDILSNKVKVIF